MNKTPIGKGIIPMLYAFFDDADCLDREAFRRQVDVCVQSGAQGIAVVGLITEVKWLTPAERMTLVNWAAEDIGGKVPLMVTVAGSDLKEVAQLATSAEAAGASALILQPPLGHRISGGELAAFYSAAMSGIPVEVGIQNAPEFLGVGLSVVEIGELRKRHANFTLMKGEGPVVQVKPFVDELGQDFRIFNGRGGLELPDNMLAGCAGMIPAPDCADIQIAMYEAFISGDQKRVQQLCKETLPYVVFAMQSLDVAILYGKSVFLRRADIVNTGRCRAPAILPDSFFGMAAERWSATFGPYANRMDAQFAARPGAPGESR